MSGVPDISFSGKLRALAITQGMALGDAPGYVSNPDYHAMGHMQILTFLCDNTEDLFIESWR